MYFQVCYANILEKNVFICKPSIYSLIASKVKCMLYKEELK